MFPQEKLSEIFTQMSKNLKWKIVLICSRGIVSVSLKNFFDDSKTTGAWWFHFFLDFSKSVPAQKILLSTRFFCLIMLHLLVNRKNHHSEVYHVTKKIIRWVFLWIQGSIDRQIELLFYCSWRNSGYRSKSQFKDWRIRYKKDFRSSSYVLIHMIWFSESSGAESRVSSKNTY